MMAFIEHASKHMHKHKANEKACQHNTCNHPPKGCTTTLVPAPVRGVTSSIAISSTSISATITSTTITTTTTTPAIIIIATLIWGS